MYISLSSLHVGHSRPLSNESKEKKSKCILNALQPKLILLNLGNSQSYTLKNQ